MPGLTRDRALAVGAPLVCLVVAGVLFALYGIEGRLSRDESIYVYGGQQLTHGVAPYVSIFDPKTPLAHFLAAAGIAVASLYGGDQLRAIRVLFYVSACLTAVAMYLLGQRVWRSRAAGVVTALVFSCFTGFAEDALSGPDAKTPGVLMCGVSMWLLAGRRWFWAGVTAALAFLVWQPFGIYAVLAVVLPLFQAERGQRLRSGAAGLLGGAIPVAACVIYFAITGALGPFVTDAILFPLNGAEHKTQSVITRADLIRQVIVRYYGVSGIVLIVGMAVVLVAAAVVAARRSGRRWRHPVVAVLLPSMIFEIAYALTDFQGYPDVYPFLAYGALGVAGLAVLLAGAAARVRARARPAVLAASLAAVAVLVAFSGIWFRDGSDELLKRELLRTCAMTRLVPPGNTLFALGDPTPLVLSGRTNPDPFIWVDSRNSAWKISHTKGGIRGWARQVLASNPAVISLYGWTSDSRYRMAHLLKSHGYTGHQMVGEWVLLSPTAAALLRAHATTGAQPHLSSATGPESADCATTTGAA